MKQTKKAYVEERMQEWEAAAEKRCAKKNIDFAAYLRDNKGRKAAQFSSEYDNCVLFQKEFETLLQQGVRPYCLKKVVFKKSAGYRTASVAASPFTGVKPAPYGELLANLREYEADRFERAARRGTFADTVYYILCSDIDDLNPSKVFAFVLDDAKMHRVDIEGIVFSSITAARTGARLAYVNTCTAHAGRKADERAENADEAKTAKTA